MSRRSVRAYVASILTGLTVPGAASPIQFYPYAPKSAPAVDMAFIDSMSEAESRSAYGGRGKRKHVSHTVRVALFSSDPDESVSTDAFDDIHQQIVNAIRNTPIPVNVTDTKTGETTTLTSIGETFTTQPSHTGELMAELGQETQAADSGFLNIAVEEEVI